MAHDALFPKIVTPKLPGPKAKAIIDGDNRYMSPSYTRDYPLVIARGEGATVVDPDGNRFLDFAAGIAVCSTGHSHPEIVQAIKNQVDNFIHMSGTDFYYDVQVRLAEKLARSAPIEGNKKVFFTNSGTEAIEGAIKLARYKTGRPHFIAFYGAFHGRTMGALSLTASKAVQKKGFAPFLAGVHHVDYAYCFRCPFNKTYPTCEIHCFHKIKDVLMTKLIAPETVAAIFVEPIQGEGGYVVPPKEFLLYLRDLCTEHGILLVADEVQSGMGRTGKLFACEHFGLKPDIICVAKGIASGLPLGAMIANEETMCWEYGSHASTFGGNPVACASGLKTFELLERELCANSAKVGAYLKKQLEPFIDKYP
ncbi:MAG: aminotransferase class III-fold pyridoxal phosphate-dependent enzyme, partial [bacterium]